MVRLAGGVSTLPFLFRPPFSPRIDQSVGGGIVGMYLFPTLQFGEDLACQLFAEFNPPLVKGENIPDHALHEDLVFIQRDQFAKRERRVISFSRKELVGRLPLKDLYEIRAGGTFSFSRSSFVFPFISASVWAKKFDSSFT